VVVDGGEWRGSLSRRMSLDSQPLRGVIAGLGVMGSHHLRVLGSMPDAEVLGVADPDPDRLAAAARAHPGVATHATLEDALDAHTPDFACLAVPVRSLPAAAHAALTAGAHVLVEKPTAATEDEAAKLLQAVDSRGLVAGVGHVERFNPAVVALKDKLDRGLIGRVVQMHARRLSPFPNRNSTLGVAFDLATHDVDVMRYLSGSEVARVSAETARPLGGAGEDLICATLRFDSDAMGVLESNWVTPTKVRQLSVTGEHGMLIVDYLTQDLCLFEHPTKPTEWDALAGMRGGGEGNMIRFALQRREPLRVQWERFLDAVYSRTEPPVGIRDGIAALSTARSIQVAGDNHETVVPNYRAMSPP
jgi:UDP-N-acetylglucosamine 3-dehydrogenase